MTRGDRQEVDLDTDPSGATVEVDGQKFTTPAEMKLKRKDVHRVTVSKPGYRTVVFDLKARWDGATLGNVALPGGSVGAVTDRATGADLSFYKLPKIKLTPSTDASAPPIEMFVHRGKLYEKAEYEKILEEEREEARTKQIL
jgi:hypothetical protein